MAYGTVNADIIGTSVPGVTLGAGNATVFKNRIINGDMRIDQRNAGASVTPSALYNTYTLDRWNALYTVGSKFSVQQNAGSVTPPAGFINYLGATSTSSYTAGATETFTIQQNIEGLNVADLGWGTTNAKTVTLSFWVRSSLTGTFGGAFQNSAQNRSYPYSYTISSANTWEYKTVTIAGDTTGTWLKTNGLGISVCFSLGTGSTYSGTAGTWANSGIFSATGATSVVGTSGATFYITGVQLEVGSSATGFEYRDYGSQLLQCQRYYAKLNNDGSGNSIALAVGSQQSTTAALFYIKYPVTMRSEPTCTISSLYVTDFTGFDSAATLTGFFAGYSTGTVQVSMPSSGAGFRPVFLEINYNQSGYLDISAEL